MLAAEEGENASPFALSFSTRSALSFTHRKSQQQTNAPAAPARAAAASKTASLSSEPEDSLPLPPLGRRRAVVVDATCAADDATAVAPPGPLLDRVVISRSDDDVEAALVRAVTGRTLSLRACERRRRRRRRRREKRSKKRMVRRKKKTKIEKNSLHFSSPARRSLFLRGSFSPTSTLFHLAMCGPTGTS